MFSTSPTLKSFLPPSCVNVFIHLNSLSWRGKLLYTLLYLATRKAKICRNFKNRKRSDMQVIIGVPVPTWQQTPSDLLLAAMVHQNHHFLSQKQRHPPPHGAYISCWGEKLTFLIQYRGRKSRACIKIMKPLAIKKWQWTKAEGSCFSQLAQQFYLRESLVKRLL